MLFAPPATDLSLTQASNDMLLHAGAGNHQQGFAGSLGAGLLPSGFSQQGQQPTGSIAGSYQQQGQQAQQVAFAPCMSSRARFKLLHWVSPLC